jgi:Raf kinase inhibitor-like YbhB/YbcL family protein
MADNGTGSGGSGGTSGSGGSGGTSGSSGSSGSGGTAGSGQSDASPGDGSTGTDVRIDPPIAMDVQADRPSTNDAPANDMGPPMDVVRDTGSQPDTAADTSSPPMDVTTADTANDLPAADTGGGSDVASDASAFVLTSTAFTEGTAIPAAHTCAGTNVSPPLSWTPGPSNTLSYAVVLTDKTNNLVHAGIYDIPASVTSLPMNVDKVANPSIPAGSKQVLAYNSMAGYAGPCPGAMAHTYEFMVYAVDIATLPGIMTSQKGAALVTALQAHDITTAKLTGTATSFR